MATAPIDTTTAETIADHEAILREIGNDPILALTNPEKVDLLVAALEADEEAADVSTKEGRSRIKKRAERADRYRLDIRAARLEKTKEWRDLTDSVNEQGKLVEPKLGALHDKIRLPLTKWEQTEAARKQEAQAIIDSMVAGSVIAPDDTSETVQARLDEIRGRNLNDELFGPQLEQVIDLRDSTVATLLAAIERLKEAEANARELARLREQEELRKQEEAERAAQAEAARKAEEDAKAAAAAEEQRKAEEAAKIAREREEAATAAQRATEEAAQKAIRDAEEKAAAEQAEAQAKADAEIAEANARALASQQEAAADRAKAVIRECNMGAIDGRPAPWATIITHLQDSVDVSASALGKHSVEVTQLLHQAIERARNELAEQQAAERKAANLAHRKKVNNGAVKAIMTCGVEDEEVAKKIVMAIAGGAVPNVSIAY